MASIVKPAEWSGYPSPGEAIKALGLGHAAWGLVAYRKQLPGLLRAGVLDSVGDGIFRKDHSDDGRAAAFWFLLSAPLMVLCGYLVEAAERSEDRRTLTISGRAVLGIGAVGTTVIPRSGFLTAMPVGYWLMRRARRASPSPVELVEELHQRQAAMYAGGPMEPVGELLAEDVVWHVPGASPIAGEHRGKQAVLEYFETRRRLAANSVRLHPGELLASEDLVVQLVGGSAEIGGERVEWSTAGIYRFEAGRVAEAWLVPSDMATFEQIWNRPSPAP